MSKTALLVIDVQTGFIDNEVTVYHAPEILKRIQNLIQSARKAKTPVIYVQHDEALEYDGLIHPSIAAAPDEIVIHKMTPDAFFETDLQQHLNDLGIENLIIVGFQTEYCINATCRKAHELGYDVTLLKDAHSTFDNDEMLATSIIEEYESALGQVVALMPSAEIKFAD